MAYRYFTKFIPKKIRNNYINLIKYSDTRQNPLKVVGFLIAFGLLLSTTLSFYIMVLFDIDFIFSFVGIFIFFEILIYLIYLLRADSKARFVENILPDVLQLMSSNLRAGLTIDRALLSSSREEFGPFQKEINIIGKEITLGKEFDESLLHMAKRIKSEKLHKTVELIVSGIRSGGHIAELLEQTAKNLRREDLVEEKIRANAMMYVIFIFVAVCFGAPALFGLSSFLVEVLTTTLGEVSMPDSMSGQMGISMGNVNIGINFVILFSVVFLICSSIFGGMILGLISKGKAKDGIRYIPFLITASLGVFFMARLLMTGLLSGFFGL